MFEGWKTGAVARVFVSSRRADGPFAIGWQVALERSLADLPPPYRANALPRLIATTFDDGGWGFRLLLSLPAVVAVVGATAIVVRA